MKYKIILLLPLLLAACASGDKIERRCPQVAVIRDLARVADFGREDPIPDELIAAGKIGDIDGTCAYGGKGVDVAFDVRFEAQRGPKLGGGRVEFPYFIALIAPDDTPQQKHNMSAAFKFPSGEDRAVMVEKLHATIPLAKGETAENWRVLIGFQLTPEQLAFNRSEKTATPPAAALPRGLVMGGKTTVKKKRLKKPAVKQPAAQAASAPAAAPLAPVTLAPVETPPAPVPEAAPVPTPPPQAAPGIVLPPATGQ